MTHKARLHTQTVTLVAVVGMAAGLLPTVVPPAKAAPPAPLEATASPSSAAVPPGGGQMIQTMAGTGTSGFAGDGGLATAAHLNKPRGLASDQAGNIFFAELVNHRVRKVDSSGLISTVAGNGESGFGGDGGPAAAAALKIPSDVDVDGVGNLYIADSGNNRIRKVDISGIITTVAGSAGSDPTGRSSGDGGPATAAKLSGPGSVRADGVGNLYISEYRANRIRKVDTSGIITTVAGNGTPGVAGDGGPATLAQLNIPMGLALHGDDLYIADSGSQRIRKIDASGTITTVAGTLRLRHSITRDPADAGTDQAPATQDPTRGTLGEISDLGLHPLLSSEHYGGDGGPATTALLGSPEGVALDGSGNLYIADTYNQRIRKVDLSGTISTIAGSNGDCGYGGDGGPATTARLCTPSAIAVDSAGNVLFSDLWNHRLRVLGVLSLATSDAPDPVPVAGRFTYTLSAGNYSTTTATGAGVTDVLAPEVVFGSADASQGSCTQAGGTVSCELGDIAAGDVATVTIAVTAPTEVGILSNTASLAATHPDTVIADDTAIEQTTVAAPAIHLTMTDAPDPVTVGQPLTYSLTATNGLVTSATEVTLTDALPPELSFRSASSSQGTCTEAGGTLTCALGTLDYSASATVTIVVTPTAGGTVTNAASVRSAEFAAGTVASATTLVSDDHCGRTITVDTVLTEDIGPCAGTGIVVGADGITLDLGGHRLFGSPGPSSATCNNLPAGTVCGNQPGIHVPNRTGVTVRNGTVSGFDAGIFLQGGGGSHTITGLAIRDNLGPDRVASYLGDGIYVENSPAAHIVGNTIVNNGHFDGIGLYGATSAGAIVENNVVEDSRGPSNRVESYGQGIIVNAFLVVEDRGRTALGIRFLNNTVRRSDSAGISNFNSSDGTIMGNIVEGNGLNNLNGNGIALQIGPGAPPGSRMLVANNQVRGNGSNGIEVGLLAIANQIIDNDASDNNRLGQSSSFDLFDRNPDCAGNVWSGNTWGSGGYAPQCTTTNGARAPITNRPVADFDGDGASDLSVFRPSNGVSYVHDGTDVAWGTDGDVAVPGDYDGVAGSEVAVFRPSTGTWFVKGGESTAWGTNGDLPVPADYDGDGKADVAVFRPPSGTWFVRPSGGGPEQVVAWGTQGDIPVPGDYDANGTIDVAVFRPSTGTWFVQGGATVNWGTDGDVPVPGDYDANGTTDMAVFRPSNGTWFVNGGATVAWGTTGDIPVPGDFDGNATADFAVFRPSSGTWFVQGGATTNWGTAGDQPLPLPAAIRLTLPT